MNKKFVTYTLTLCLLLLVAAPAQVFAATKCPDSNKSQCNVTYYTQSNKNCNGNYFYNNLSDNYSKNCNSDDNCYYNYNCNTKSSKNCNTNTNCNTNCDTNSSCDTSKNCNTNKNGNVKQYCFDGKGSLIPCSQTPGKPSVPNAPDAPSKPASPSSPGAGESLSGYAQQVVNLVNKERATAGLSPLSANTNLAAVATKKAEDMRDKNYFSHTSPTYGSPFDMMSQFGIKYTAAGENIAKGQRTPESVMSAWMNSAGHRENIMSAKYNQIGVGYVTDSKGNTYWVQMFIK